MRGTASLCLLSFLVATPAHADDPTTPVTPGDDGGETPWSRGVSPENKARAQALLEEGNALIVQNLHKEALARYEDALAAWDHPAIRFNMVRALINLERPLEAAENLERALTYGEAPLGAEVFAEASTYQRLLAQQIGRVVVGCDQPDVVVTIDGGPALGPCPGRHEVRLRAGTHTLAAERSGYLSITRREAVDAGDNAPIEVRLTAITDATVTRTRWATWKPWAVTGVGVAAGGVGAALLLSARGLRDDYQAALVRECGELACADEELPIGTSDMLDRAHTRNRLGIAAAVVGGVTIASGVAMVILNRPYTVVETPRVLAVTPTSGGFVVGVGGAL